MKNTRTDAGRLILGGEPRIDFLPPEIQAGKDAKRTRRSLIALVLVVVAVCAGGYVYATSLSVQADAELAAAQARTLTLVKQQGEFNEVRTVTGKLAATTTAQQAGSANEVLWAGFLDSVVGVLPSGAVIDSYQVTSQMSTESGAVPNVPLQEPRIATMRFEVTLLALADAKVLLDRLATLDGYADAWASSIEFTDDAQYTASFTLNINADVLSLRFFPETVEPEVAEPESGDAIEGEG